MSDEKATAASPTVGVIELDRPLLVNGAERRNIPYDVTKITADQMCEAEALSKRGTEFCSKVCEMDYAFHLHLGFQAAIACDPSLDVSDLRRVAGPDLKKFMDVGRFFMTASDDAEEPTSDEQCASTPEDSQPQ